VEEVAFGIRKLRVAAVITDPELSTDTVIEAVGALHDYGAGSTGHDHGHGHGQHGHAGHHGGGGAVEAKKMVQSVEFVAFTK
jgi:hypothetical protein